MTFDVDGKELRLHFNRHGAAPLVWCVTTAHFEIAVKGFRTYAPFNTVYRPKTTPDDEDGKPSAWLAPTQVSRCYNVSISQDGWAEIRFADEVQG